LDFIRLQVVRSLGLLQRQHPGIAISVKTRQAIRSVLNNARDTLYELRSNGVLDKNEANKLEREIEVKMKQQLHAPAFIPPKKPEDLLKSLVWLQGLEDDAVTYITSNAEMLSFDFGDVILKQGEVCDGIYLIISGMVKLLGVSKGTVDLQQLTQPNQPNFQISADYLFAGNVIGEMGLLTDSVRNASVTCETTVQVYFISVDKMQRAMKRFTGLTDGLWRVCGMRIAVPLLMEHQKYQIWSKEHLRIICENSQMASLDDSMLYRLPDDAQEAILIHGKVQCARTKEEFAAPIILPKNRKSFTYDQKNMPRIMLIVNYKADMTLSPISNVEDKMDDNTTSNKDKEHFVHRTAGCQVKQTIVNNKNNPSLA